MDAATCCRDLKPEEALVENFVGKVTKVPFDSLFLDPNNPRLGQANGGPGYNNPDELFSKERQVALEQLLSKVYDVDRLMTTISGQGWMPIDNILVWAHPDRPNANVVVEGNTRTLALRQIRGSIIEREQQKLSRMEKGGKAKYAEHDLQEQRDKVRGLEQIVRDTNEIFVAPLAAKSVEELEHKLPRVLAVRHITGTKPWGNFAEDLWFLQRYIQLFEDKHSPSTGMHWDPEIIKRVADEASLTQVEMKRKLRASSAFSHFKAEFEDRLPVVRGKKKEFEPKDYYVFENIVKKPFLRQQLGLEDDLLRLPISSEEAIFEWVFKLPRGKTADDNENIFYRQENVLVWDQMYRYDLSNGTNFASRFDVEDPKNAPTMKEVEAEFDAHKLRRKPHAVLEDLLRLLRELSVETLLKEGEFLQRQLEELHSQSKKLLLMIKAAA
jgi:hypothetical protein